MSGKMVYSVCGMCSVRCPIQVEVEDGQCRFIQGNRRSPGIRGALCARGASGLAFQRDDERPQFPMLRKGERGQGRWQRLTWDQALDHAAEKLKAARDQFGGRSIMWSDGGGPFSDLPRALVRGLGSPNYFGEDASCCLNLEHAALSLFGFGHEGLAYDFRGARHVVLQTRNIFESINVREVNELLDGMEAGCKLTVIDIRATVSAAKADRFMLIRPGTDHALNLAIIHVLLERGLYDADYVKAHIKGVAALRQAVATCTPEFAEQETGVKAADLVALAEDLAQAAPAVIWHPGWMTSRYADSFQVCRTAYIINALLGSIGAKGGLALASTPADLGHQGLKRLTDLVPASEEKRVDGVGWKYPQFKNGPGLLHLAFKAIQGGDPYPPRAYVAFNHDPLGNNPDPDTLKAALGHLDFLACVTSAWTDTAWHADLVLPLSSYLERESIVAEQHGLRPAFFLRQRCLAPRFDTRADWEIISGLARRLDLKSLAFQDVGDIWRYQLEGTGARPEHFMEKGFLELSDRPIYKPLTAETFPTATGRIEFVSPAWEEQGLPSLAAYSSRPAPPEGRFRLTVGRCGLHTPGLTENNPLLGRQMPENFLWLNQGAAKGLGIADGDTVVVSSNGHSGRIKALLTDLIHPEAVFMVHGFGHALPPLSRARGRGLADNILMPGGLDKWDPAGGGLALQEHFVAVRKA